MLRPGVSAIVLCCVSLGACRSDHAGSTGAPADSAPEAVTVATAAPPVASAPVLSPPVDLPPASTASPGGPLHQRLVGIWTFEASPATRAKIVAEFKRTIRDPKEAEAASKKFEEGLSHMTLQITGDAMVTRQDDKEVGKERYEVVSEDKDRITVRMVVSRKQQVLVFKDDRTVDLHDDKMGQVLLHKR